MKLRYLCCLRRRGTGAERPEEVEIAPALAAAAAAAAVIDETEIQVEQWEEELRQCDEGETELRDRLPAQEGAALLSALQSNPDLFLSHDDPDVRRLAERRLKVAIFGEKMSVKPFSSSAAGTNPIIASLTQTPPPPLASPGSRVSQAWARKLDGMVPTQGSLRKSVRERNILRTKPKFPEWLVDESYEVVKRNEYGKRLPRSLKLTEFHILMASKEAGVTKVYSYADVVKVDCALQPAGEERLWLVFKRDKRSFLLYSPVAQVITQQITTRIRVRESLQQVEQSILMTVGSASTSPTQASSASSSAPDEAARVGYSPVALDSFIQAICSRNCSAQRSLTLNVLSFATSLLDRVIPDRPSAGRQRSANTDGVNFRRRSTRVDCKPGKPPYDEAAVSQRLLVVDKGSKDLAVLERVRFYLHSSAVPEGNTRRHFVKGFAPRQRQDAVEARMWIEGMHEYVFLRRGVELAEIMGATATASSPATASAATSASVTMDGGSATGEGGDDRAAAEATALATMRQLDEASLLVLSYLVYSAVEEALFAALEKRIQAALHSAQPTCRERERLLVDKISRLASRPLAAWGVPEEQRSPLLYSTAAFELRGVEQYPTPSKRLNAVLSASKAIFSEYLAHCQSLAVAPGQPVPVLSADDLVPIFIYVLCQTGLETPLLDAEMLWDLCHPDSLYGEGGYFLTVFESAIAFVESCDE